jgi:hypothetical protein
MRQQKRIKVQELGAPGMRRVLEAMRRHDNELACWDEKEAETKVIPGEANARDDQPRQ